MPLVPAPLDRSERPTLARCEAATGRAHFDAMAAVLSHVEGMTRDEALTILLVALAAGATGVILW